VHRHLEYFSLGGLLALVWTPRTQMLPWMVIALVLVSVGAWGVSNAAGRVDFVLIASVAAYELIIGLTEKAQRA
jgi:alpha-beta hydrolase superfamily lysophospholipase